MSALLDRLPTVENCCRCVTDLKSAAAIIAVLGIVTSPAFSWAIVRHTYIIRMSCYLTSANTKPDIVDVNLHNLVSFGLGSNAGLGPACVLKNDTRIKDGSSLRFTLMQNTAQGNGSVAGQMGMFQAAVNYTGYFLLLIDMIFVVCSFVFLVMIFRGNDQKSLILFMSMAAVTTVLSYTYGLMYISSCVIIGGNFPVCDLVFITFDLIVWVYFLIVVNSYRQKT